MNENENLFLTYLHEITAFIEDGNYHDALSRCVTVAEICCAADEALLDRGIEPCAERISKYPRLAIDVAGMPGMYGKPVLTPEEIYHLRDILYPLNVNSDKDTKFSRSQKRTRYTFAAWHRVNSYDSSVKAIYKDISLPDLINAILETAYAFYLETPELVSEIENHQS